MSEIDDKVSIIIPYIRKEGMERCKDAIFKNSGVPKEQFEILTSFDGDRIGAPLMVKFLVDVAKHDLVMFLGDDTVPQPDFLSNALQVMAKIPDGWGLVGLNDGVQNGLYLATHWLGHKKLLSLIDGEFFHTGYYHCFCDNELTQRATALGRYLWSTDAKIKHLNPMVTPGVETDEDYKRVYSLEWFFHDQVLFWKRKRNNWKNPNNKNQGE